MSPKQGQCPPGVKRSSYPNGISRVSHLCPQPSPLKEHPKAKHKGEDFLQKALAPPQPSLNIARGLPSPGAVSSQSETLNQLWSLEDPGRGRHPGPHPSPCCAPYPSPCCAPPCAFRLHLPAMCLVLSLRRLPWFLWDQVPQTRQLKQQNPFPTASGGLNPRRRVSKLPTLKAEGRRTCQWLTPWPPWLWTSPPSSASPSIALCAPIPVLPLRTPAMLD